MRNKGSALWIAIILTLGNAFSAHAATVPVQVGSVSSGSVFVPATANIAVNDTVVWNWVTSLHSTTSGNNPTANGLWESGVANPPHTFSYTFTNSGTYPYYCSFHGSFGMTGSVIVTKPNPPPTVSITNPISGAVLAAPANVTIQATASDDGTVTNVQFRVGAAVLANKTTAPFFAVTNNLPAGNYTLTAIAADNLGAKATNTVSLNVVIPPPLAISDPQFSTGDFHFSYAASTGLTYIVQRSINLAGAEWVALVTNTAASNPAVFVDVAATNDPAFYRVGLLPNP